MKTAIKLLLMPLVTLTLLTACAEQPDTELGAAKIAMAAIVGEGAEQYAPNELQSINRKFDEAMAEIKAQDSKTLKNFSLAKFTLSQIVEDCTAMKVKIAQRKADEAKTLSNATPVQAPAVAVVVKPKE